MASREVVCYHEAGHLVAYLANKIPTKDATIFIFESKERPGKWQGWISDVQTAAIEPRLQMIVRLVGPVTVKKRFGTHFTGDEIDLKDAENFCSAENIDFEDVMQDSQRFVDAPGNWAAIERIAH